MGLVFKKKHLKGSYFYLVILFSGYSISFFTSPEGLILIFIIGLLIFGKTLARPTRPLLIAMTVWVGFFIVNTLVIKSFHPYFMSTYIVYIIVAWWLISFYKEKIFESYEYAIYKLSIVSLILYSWQIIHFKSLYSVIKYLDLSQDMFPNRGYASVIFYSIRTDMDSFFPQNSGFTWEPGPFSCFVVLAIFLNLARNKIIFKDKSKLLVLFITLISTQSTTGFIALSFIILWVFYSRFKNIYARSILMPFVAALIFIIFENVPILSEKIISESKQDVDILIENSVLYDSSYNPGRFASFQLGWIDFKNHPIVGIGGHSKARYAAQQGADVSTINGFALIMTRYGSIGLIIFFILIFNTGKWISNFYSCNAYLILPLLFLIISFSFRIIETPLFVTLWISSLFLNKYSGNKNKLWQKKFYFS